MSDMNQEIDRVIPTYVAELVTKLKPFAFIAGGFVRSILGKEPIKDLDIFLLAPEHYQTVQDILLSEGFHSLYSNAVVQRFTKTIARVTETTSKIVYSVDLIEPTEQTYTKTFGSPEEVISNFDFSICRGALVNVKEVNVRSIGTFLIDPDMLRDIDNKVLRIKHIVCPIGTARRIPKYLERGYKINTSEVMKLFVEFAARPKEWQDTLAQLLQRTDRDQEGYEGLSDEELAKLYLLLLVD